jgi:phospholipase C
MATPTITNIVVLMMENRSYDNVLGGLYLTNTPPPGQKGLNGINSDCTNVNPSDTGETITMQPAASTILNGNTIPATAIPYYDPGEPFDDMAQQIWGLPATPPSTGTGSNPTSAGSLGMMGGFTTNFYQQTYEIFSKPPNPEQSQDVMTYLTPPPNPQTTPPNPGQIPVTAWLAQNFAVSDQWFGSVPTQTFANRMFAFCAAPGVLTLDPKVSCINDVPDYGISWTKTPPPAGPVTLPSVLELLDNTLGTKGSVPNWKVYYHDYPISVLLDYVMQKALSSSNINVAPFDISDYQDPAYQPSNGIPQFLTDNSLQSVPTNFQEDLDGGTLPMFSFIEPRYSNSFGNKLAPNSNHPGSSVYLSRSLPPPIDVSNGEILLATVYNALQASSYWDNTLLIVTYDEHGGMYDHVVPPAATPPGSSTPPASNGYTFDTFGPRVPALLISPWITAGSTIRPASATIPFDHTTIIKTVFDCFLPSGTASLTDRDGAAESLIPLLTGSGNSPGAIPLNIIPS